MSRHVRPVSANRGLLCAMAATVALTLGACSGSSEPDDTEQTQDEPTAQDRLDQAYAAFTDAGSVSLLLEGTDLPEDRNTYVISADGAGTMDPAAFDGTITARLSGVQADVPTIAVDDALYVKLPFAPGFIATDPEELGVPDPARLFDSEVGVASLLQQTESPEFGEQRRAGQEIVQEVTGTLPGDLVVRVLDVGSGDEGFEVVYGLIEQGWEVRTVTLTGEFYPPATSTYTLTLDDYGEPVTVTAP
ncbi:MAG TPA: LppX_LprAFG lipoprotein [Ornithinimicrobium sp.]|uniref:LppX_LprAFG lipoprotein n=1 Tax=Ornithinimicrobium sp. TaxID=1977084 RepID=UPI002B49B806|nr:LppX_LprAFG lipoprotein [Ornithinimicrobium sp.]HKJ11002.1 LppX_LprAFG lipoprotein [Ornithinimicrobium sp.]